MRRRELSAEEIEVLADQPGLALESAIVIEGDDEVSYEVRIAGITGTICAEYFSAVVEKAGPGRFRIRSWVRMPTGDEVQFPAEWLARGPQDPNTRRRAFRGIVTHALDWGRRFRHLDAMRAQLSERIADIEGAASRMNEHLQTVDQDGQPECARRALRDALDDAARIGSGVEALRGIVAHL